MARRTGVSPSRLPRIGEPYRASDYRDTRPTQKPPPTPSPYPPPLAWITCLITRTHKPAPHTSPGRNPLPRCTRCHHIGDTQ